MTLLSGFLKDVLPARSGERIRHVQDQDEGIPVWIVRQVGALVPDTFPSLDKARDYCDWLEANGIPFEFSGPEPAR